MLLTACGGDSESAAGPVDQASAPLTYHRDIRALMGERCASCHQPGNIAPFSLTSYGEVYALRAAVAAAVESGSMPPWQPAAGCNEYLGDSSLDSAQRDKISAWVASGAPEGDPADYVKTVALTDTFASDLDMRLPEPYAPRLKPDDYRCFLLEWPADKPSFITGFRVAPDRLDMVHHVLAYIAAPEQVVAFRALDDADEGPGYTCYGGPGADSGIRPFQIGGWAPGAPSGRFPDGTGIEVQPGSLMVVQMHYNTLTTASAADQSSMQVMLADQVERPALTMLATAPRWLQPGGMTIPAGQAEVTHSQELDIALFFAFLGGAQIGLAQGDAFVVHAIGMHMHQLGRRGVATLVHADGSEQCLLDIPDWDFAWQGSYRLATPITMQPEDRIRVTCTWDNSAANQRFEGGQQVAPRDVEWGEGTQDEMCLVPLFITAP